MSNIDILSISSYEEFLELQRKLRQEQIPSYKFSKISQKLLKEILPIKREVVKKSIFDSWFQNQIEISQEDSKFLKELLQRERDFIEIYKEEDLKVKFIAPILNRVDFRDIEREIRDFYDETLTYSTTKFIFNGNPDFFVSKGLDIPEKPFFFIQEFKQSQESSYPEFQLVAEMVAGLELSNFQMIRGAYIRGEDWYFVILEKIEEKYKYYVSDGFNSKEIEKLEAIYRNLLFVKNEIIETL